MLSDPDYSAMLFISLRLASFSYRVAYLLIIILMDVYNTLYIVRVRHVLLEWSSQTIIVHTSNHKCMWMSFQHL